MATLLTPTVAGGSGTAISVAKPSGSSNGDLAIVFLWNNEATYADNNGAAPFAFDAAAYNVSGTGSHRIAYRVINGTEGANFLFTNGTAQRWGAVAHIWQGLHASPFAVARTNGNAGAGTGGTAVSINTVNANDIHIAAYGTDGANTLSTLTQAGYTGAGVTNTAGGQKLSVAYKVIASASATGTVSWTQNSENFQAYSLALRDAGGAPPTPNSGFFRFM